VRGAPPPHSGFGAPGMTYFLNYPSGTLLSYFRNSPQLVTENPYWPRLDIMGPTAFECSPLKVLGEGDEEKRICWAKEFKVSSYTALPCTPWTPPYTT
jgi:hypothetical protein